MKGGEREEGSCGGERIEHLFFFCHFLPPSLPSEPRAADHAAAGPLQHYQTTVLLLFCRRQGTIAALHHSITS